MSKSIKAYGDGRLWDDLQCQRVANVIGILQVALIKNDLVALRKKAVWFMDVLFPTGFAYEVNHGPSEDIHSGYMYCAKMPQ